MPTLKVFVNEAADLFGADLDGKSDPYCVLKIGEGNQFSAIEKTSRVKNTKNPMWKECFTLNVNNPLTESLFIEVWNQEKTKDDSLGYAQIPLHDLQRNVEKQIWIQLQGGSTGGNIIGAIASHLHKKKGEKINHGKVFLGLTALDFGIDPSIAQQQFGMQQGIGQQGMQQHGIGMQQQHLMGQGIGMQQPMMQQGMMHNQPGFQQGINQPMMPTCTQCPTVTPLMMQQPGYQHTPCTHFNQGINNQPGMMHTQPGMMNQGMMNQGPVTTHKDLHDEHKFERQQGIHKGVGEKLQEHKDLHNQGTGTTFNQGGINNQGFNQGIHTQPGMVNQGLHTNNQPGLVQQPCVTHGIHDNCAVQQAGPVLGHKDLHNEHKLEKEQGIHKGLKEKLQEHKELHDIKKADKLEDRAMEKQAKAMQTHDKHTDLNLQNQQGFTQGTGIQNQRGVQQGNFQPGMIQPPSTGGYQGGVAGVSVLPPTHGAVAGNQAVNTPQIPSTTMPINTGLSTHPTNVEHGHHTINQGGIHNQGIQQPLFNQGQTHATTGTTTTMPTTLNNQFHSTTRPPVLGNAEGLSEIERAEREKHKI